jgi:hypothetical protein
LLTYAGRDSITRFSTFGFFINQTHLGHLTNG